jgi:hypothetical protein
MLNNYTARVVNMPSRPDRLETLSEEMAKIGLEYEIFPAVDPPDCPNSAVGSVHSHIEALKGVKGNLFVFEDDICFVDQARELFDIAFNELPFDWDILYLGGNPKVPQNRYSEHLFKSPGGIHCNHAILYAETARNFILNEYKYDYRTNEIGIFDHWLFMIGQKKMNCFIISPMIAWQKPGYSNCRGSYMDYYMHIRSNEIRHMI